MAIKILIDRKFRKQPDHGAHYHNAQLRSLATVQAGYISGQTMVNVDNPNEMMIISTWASKEDWDNWYESEMRRNYYKNLRQDLETDEEISFYTLAATQ